MNADNETVCVDKSALARVLTALNGPLHHIRELQVTRGLPGDSSPIDLLIEQYNAAPASPSAPHPGYWAAVDDGGCIAFGMSVEDGNHGEAARTEVNDDINERSEEYPDEPLHLVRLYTASPSEPIGWVYAGQIEKLHDPLNDISGIMIHDEPTPTCNVPVYTTPQAASPSAAVAGEQKPIGVIAQEYRGAGMSSVGVAWHDGMRPGVGTKLYAGPVSPSAAVVPAELIERLRMRYEPRFIPPCRVCGGELSIGPIGGGEPTRWGCDGMMPDPRNPAYFVYKDGRSRADEHYQDSRWFDFRQGGDEDVIELLDAITGATP